VAPLIGAQPGRDVGFDAALARAGRMPTVSAEDVDWRETRHLRWRAKVERRALIRSRWWYPIVLVLVLAAGVYSVMRADQRIAAVLVWPSEGSQFVEVGDSASDPDYRDTMTIVAGGLNRKSGNLVAGALMPSLGGSDVRVFSLVYGSGIYDDDINSKFDALFQQYRPTRLVLVGNSMGGDVVLNIAEHFQHTFADPGRYPEGQIVPYLDTIYLDCTPLGTADVRAGARAQADFLTGLTEHLGTDGGAATRLAAEMLVQRRQWSYGRYPDLIVYPDHFGYKWAEVWREKLNRSGVSTALVKDQYGVIRKFDADRVLGSLDPVTHLVFLRPDVPNHDQTIDVERVEDQLRVFAAADGLELTVLDVPGSSHASAIRDADAYNRLISFDSRKDVLRRIGQLVR
jgi:pimeloyl-ACP methyl ester carboxylesterase